MPATSLIPLTDETAELAIVREAVVTGHATPLAEQLCRKYYARPTQPRHDWTEVANIARDLVCARMAVSRAEMDGYDRHEPVAYARFTAMHLLRRFTPFSTVQIARIFARHHAAVLSGAKALKSRVETCTATRKLLRGLEREFATITGLTRRPL